MKAYKVVYCDSDGKLWSYSDCGQVEYAIGIWTTPRKYHGPLSAFKSCRLAMKFLNKQGYTLGYDYEEDIRIYECEVEISKEKELWFYTPYGKLIKNDVLPDGTILCNMIKLTKFVAHYRAE